MSFYSACVSLCKHDPTSAPNQGMLLSRGSALQTDPLVGICARLRVCGFLRPFCRFALVLRPTVVRTKMSLNLPRFARHSPAHLGLKGFDGGKGLKGCRAQKLQNNRKPGLVGDIKSNDKERSVQQANTQQFQILLADFFFGNSCQALLGIFIRSIFRSP